MDNQIKKSWFRNKIVAVLLVVVTVFLAGYLLISTPPKKASEAEKPTAQLWTCSMHPQIIRDKPGKCPICGMDLIPLKTHLDSNETPQVLVLSQEAVKIMEIETSVVERKPVTAEIKLFGKIDYDETQIKNITAWVAGRIDRLFVDFTGISVKKGDHLVELYSPQLISTRAELVEALKAAANLKPDSTELLKSSTSAVLEAAREKLRLLGLTSEQIKSLESGGQTITHITIFSPIGGVVIQKNATEGTYVDTGTSIYTVADLSHLWARLDAYESDLVWIRYGQDVELTVEAYPGRIFHGKISFIDPVLDEKTRTVKVRVNIDNSDRKLKPGMFVNAIVHSKVAADGVVFSDELVGKWICPMHPDVISSEPGSCTICGMALVTTESLGFVEADTSQPPLLIPASAPLITGTRAIVYVQDPNIKKPTFEGREIMLGPRAGDYYIVKSGLSEGEIVATRGNFRIDAALQLQARPSMMNPKPSPMPTEQKHNH